LAANNGTSGIKLPPPIINYYEKKKQVLGFIVPDGYDERLVMNRKRGRGRPRKYPRKEDVMNQIQKIEESGSDMGLSSD